MSVSQKIQDLIAKNNLKEAILELDKLLFEYPLDDDLYFERGRLHWRLGNRRDAINDYESAVAINSRSKAVYALENARDVLNFFNSDLLNP